MGQAELLIAGLLVAVAGLSALARQLSVPTILLSPTKETSESVWPR
ncbi:MAG: hypothetical protein LC751_02090 [Actinobacteria bacterium]|nr:hypothetical protein [Actinomycetota bacterium]